MIHGLGGVDQLGMTDRLGERAEAEFGEQLAHLLGDVVHEVLDELRFAAVALP